MAYLSLAVAQLTAAPSLTITAPADGSSAAPGQTLAVTVTTSGSFTQVVLVGEGPIGYSSIITASPYQFSLPIPANISPGRYSLTALGVSATGNATSAAITISVERPDAPVQIDVAPTILYLPVGARVPLRVVGTYADGTQLDITHSVSTTFSSTSASAATVDTQGYVTAVGATTGQEPPHIVVNSSLSIPVVVPPELSVAPQWPVLYASQREQFSAVQPGMAAVPVNWTINPQVGSISNSGVYTAPGKITTQQAVTITATLRSDSTKSASSGVALYPPVAVAISPGTPVTLTAGQTLRFSQTVYNSLDNNVTWSISPKNAGSIDDSGLYATPATLKTQGTVVVTATSIADSTKSASTTVTIQP